ncbi:flagellar hook protein FlgE [Thiomicrospira microaerophila]|uniref:flagellar hook protein FlgE n=1 Tax=Thiomicrospira microaerophila TaxID=406020 RepID=UPI0005CAE0D8|nr:flagellar hook protein FlgE [Thiomicrospira microaerophila]
MSAYDLNALSGINAMSQGLSVVSNNLANAQTMGFKSSRAEFADMFSGSQNSPGNGVRVEKITQDFSQGTIAATGRELDMAIDGEGFFILEDKSGKYSNIYTRNGSFKLDKEGFVTDQVGNNLLGFNLNPDLSTETRPVFDTALGAINLADLNKTPRATDEMTYNINVDGEALRNVDPNGTAAAVAGDPDDHSVGATNNLQRLLNPAGGTYQGFPDFTYPTTIYDSLGGQHVLQANFYKRDVVPEGASTTAADGSPVGAGQGVKYTSWLVQYTVSDKEGNLTGQLAAPDGTLIEDPANNPLSGQVYELRFDTNGQYLGAYQPIDYQTGGVLANLPVGAPVSSEAINSTDLGDPLDPTADPWTRVDGQPTLNFLINPLNGATDPLGGEIVGQPQTFEIKVDFAEMTQFAGDNLLRGVTQNGFKIGDLVGLTTSREGIIEARYSNGRSIPVAQLALGNFNDLNAMEKLGGQMYAESFGSGPVQISKAGSGVVGAIQAGSLEYSNVDTAGELVKMIQLQRTYQASAQVISTSQELTRTILNL